MGRRQALFQDPTKALNAAFDIAQRQNRGGQRSRRQELFASGTPVHATHQYGRKAPIMPTSTFGQIVREHDGRPWQIHSSEDERELELYDYKEFVHPIDRHYLNTRDPTARFATITMTRDVWAEPPRIARNVENRDGFRRFFLDLYKKGFFREAWAGHKMARRDGGGFVYIQATGDPSSPLQEGDRIAGFDTIPIDSVPDRFIEMTKRSNDPLVRRHGVQRIVVKDDLQEEDPTQVEFMEIHGSRLLLAKEDPEGDGIASNPILNAIHDDLWNWRDTAVAGRDGVMQGNPIAVDVKTEDEYSVQRVPADQQGTDNDPYQVVVEEMEDWQQGYLDSFAPVEGIELKRLGPSEVDIPGEAVSTYVGRIASELDVTRAKVMATADTSGGGQMGNVDQDEYGRAIQALQKTQAFPLLSQMVQVGKRIGVLKRRPELHPGDVEWGDPLFYNKRQEAFIQKSHAQAASIIDEQAVRKVSAETERLLPKDASKEPPESVQNQGPGGDGQGSNNNQSGQNASRARRREEIKDIVREMHEMGELDG